MTTDAKTPRDMLSDRFDVLIKECVKLQEEKVLTSTIKNVASARMFLFISAINKIRANTKLGKKTSDGYQQLWDTLIIVSSEINNANAESWVEQVNKFCNYARNTYTGIIRSLATAEHPINSTEKTLLRLSTPIVIKVADHALIL